MDEIHNLQEQDRYLRARAVRLAALADADCPDDEEMWGDVADEAESMFEDPDTRQIIEPGDRRWGRP